MSSSPKFLLPNANKALALVGNGGAKAVKAAAKIMGASFLEVEAWVAEARAYKSANVWSAASLAALDWSAFNPA